MGLWRIKYFNFLMRFSTKLPHSVFFPSFQIDVFPIYRMADSQRISPKTHFLMLRTSLLLRKKVIIILRAQKSLDTVSFTLQMSS